MSTRTIRVVIGKNFGDEGKGLAVDYFCSRAPRTLVVKHNGGAQAGHTVEQSGRRFVFRQLSAGSFRRSDTLWARTYYPDLYKLREEEEEFAAVAGFRPMVWSDAAAPVTLIDDVLINQFLETRRGAARHGSCGMGIYEATLRTKAGLGLTVGDIVSENTVSLTARILQIRREYTRKRIAEAIAAVASENERADGGRSTAEAGSMTNGCVTAGVSSGSVTAEEILRQGLPGAEYLEMLQSDEIVENYAEEMLRNAAKYVSVAEDVGVLLRSSENIVFESGQGLLLDENSRRFAPHISASKTGLANPVMILAEHGLAPTEAVYVTRSYVTRHGAGPLPYECTREELGIAVSDATNVDNPWQGAIRYATHGTPEEFTEPVREDLKSCRGSVCASLFMTHLDETDGCVLTANGPEEHGIFRGRSEIRDVFGAGYAVFGREAGDVVRQ